MHNIDTELAQLTYDSSRDRDQDREEEVGGADAEEGGEGVVQVLAALGDERDVDAPAEAGLRE